MNGFISTAAFFLVASFCLHFLNSPAARYIGIAGLGVTCFVGGLSFLLWLKKKDAQQAKTEPASRQSERRAA